MVAYFTMRTHGVNQAFRFVEGIWLHRKRRQSVIFTRKDPIFFHACATCNELPSNISTMAYIALDSQELKSALYFIKWVFINFKFFLKGFKK